MKHIPTVCLSLVTVLLMVAAVVVTIAPTPTDPSPLFLMGMAIVVGLMAVAHTQLVDTQ